MRRTRIVLAVSAVLALLCSLAVGPTASAAPAWTPEPEQFGVAMEGGVPIPMPDGTVLEADVQRPAAIGHSTPADGTFPVLLLQTPYGRALLADEMSYFVKRGYIAVSVDVRGTGSSGGAWSPWGPAETTDALTIVDFAAKLPHSNGTIGLYGDSYKGINQLTTAAAVGPHSPVKAIFPVVAGNDLYRDLFNMGGAPNNEFLPLWLLLTGTTSLVTPVQDALKGGSPQAVLDALGVELQHAGGTAANLVPLLTATVTGGAEAYDDAYWQARNPVNILDEVVANGIPAFLVSGWNDLFQRGAMMNYSGLQNAAAGRPVTAPMVGGQPVSNRYQLLMGPWYHVPGTEVDLPALKLAWYDQWLKGVDTGILDTDTPLHAYQVGTGLWKDTKDYPFTEAAATTYFMGHGGTLTPAKPAANADWITWVAANSPCTRSTTQWLGGLNLLSAPACSTDDKERETGVGALVYTTDAVTAPTVISGPISASIYAQSNTPDTQWVVTVTDVGPDGSSTPLSEGALTGSLRAVDEARSWKSSDGHYLMPYHPYTKASEQLVEANKVTRYDVEVFPTFATIAPGHKIRVVITTADTPHLSPTLAQLPRLLLGLYQVQVGGDTASSVTIPLAPAGAFGKSCAICR